MDNKGIERSKEIELRFIDSFKFMRSSLDALVNNLACRGNYHFLGFEEYNENQYTLLIKKGIYPYEYMNDWDKFKETELTLKEAFYSKLNMTGVSKGDYEHANRTWKVFGLADLGEYHDLYLNPISTGLFCLVVALGGGGVFHPPSITPLSLKLDCSNFVRRYFQIG